MHGRLSTPMQPVTNFPDNTAVMVLGILKCHVGFNTIAKAFLSKCWKNSQVFIGYKTIKITVMEVTDSIVAFLADRVSYKFMACPQAYIKYGLIHVFWFDVYYNTILSGGDLFTELFTGAYLCRSTMCILYHVIVSTACIDYLSIYSVRTNGLTLCP